MVYAIDSESSPTSHPNWRNGVRVGPVNGDYITAFIPPFERENRVYQGAAGEGVAVDADGNVAGPVLAGSVPVQQVTDLIGSSGEHPVRRV